MKYVGKSATGGTLYRKGLNRSGVLASIGYVMGTGRANRNTEEAMYRILGTEDDLQAATRALKGASDAKLLEVLEAIDSSQPGALPKGSVENARAAMGR